MSYLCRRTFRGSNSVPFSDTFWVQTTLNSCAATASAAGPTLVHQHRAACAATEGIGRNYAFTFRVRQAVPDRAAAGPSLGFGFDARRSLRRRPSGGLPRSVLDRLAKALRRPSR